jgi:hypothetical protein
MVAVSGSACHREAVEPSAVAPRRTRASLALAAGGALVLMAGVACVATGAALRLEHQVHSVPLVVPGLVLTVLGLALGASAAVTVLLDAPTGTPPAPPYGGSRAGGHPFAAGPFAAGPAAGPAPAEPEVRGATVAGEVLSSFVLPGRPPPAPVTPTEVVPGAPLAPPGRPRTAPLGPAPSAPVQPEGVPARPVPSAREPLAGEVPGYSDAGWDIASAGPPG